MTIQVHGDFFFFQYQTFGKLKLNTSNVCDLSLYPCIFAYFMAKWSLCITQRSTKKGKIYIFSRNFKIQIKCIEEGKNISPP